MRTSVGLLLATSGVGAKCRKSWLIATCILTPLSLAMTEPVLAECAGPINDVVCDVAGNTYSLPVSGNLYQTHAGINVGGARLTRWA